MLRRGEKYLQEKYPGYTLNILTFERANTFTPWAVLRFQYKDSDVFKAFVMPKEGENSITDTFYTFFLQPKYDAMVENIFLKMGLRLRSKTDFPNAVGRELDASADVASLLEKMPELPRDTQLFLFGGEESTNKEMVELVIREHGLYGSYTLYCLGDADGGSMDELLAGRGQYTRHRFNCFKES